LKRDARIDALTGVFNRRALESAVFDRVTGHERFGVLFMDLDHFKSVNDEFGHGVGDEVLRSTAEALKGGIRPGDVIGRYGGEEFVVIVAGAGPESARLVADRLRHAVSMAALPSPGPGRVTISVGATVFDPRIKDEDPGELLKRADKALYAAKAAGRDCVVSAAHDGAQRIERPRVTRIIDPAKPPPEDLQPPELKGAT
jgi:diguanylate cyclase (GGDEF)-like protein